MGVELEGMGNREQEDGRESGKEEEEKRKGKGKGREREKVSSLVMKAQPNSEAEPFLCICMRFPQNPGCTGGYQSTDVLLTNGMLPFKAFFSSAFGDGEILHTVVPTLCLGHHESRPALGVYPVVPQVPLQLCPTGPEQTEREGMKSEVLPKLSEPSGMVFYIQVTSCSWCL